jgi:hypothetical protein
MARIVDAMPHDMTIKHHILKEEKTMEIHHSITRYGQALGAALVVLFATVFATPAFTADKKPVQVGTITMEQIQVALIGSGNSGTGKLQYKGKTYPFRIAGLGVGGIGISKIDAHGEVYDMKNIADFAGTYGQARSGIVVGTVSKGSMWLENSKGVYLRVTTKRQGVALSLGADGIVIQMDK